MNNHIEIITIAALLVFSFLLTSCDTIPNDVEDLKNDAATQSGNKDDEKEPTFVPAGKKYEEYAEADKKYINAETLGNYAVNNFLS